METTLDTSSQQTQPIESNAANNTQKSGLTDIIKSKPLYIAGPVIIILLAVGALTLYSIKSKPSAPQNQATSFKIAIPSPSISTAVTTPLPTLVANISANIQAPHIKPSEHYKNGFIYLTNSQSGDLLYKIDLNSAPQKIYSGVESASISPSKDLIAFNHNSINGETSRDTNIYIYDLNTNKIINKIVTQPDVNQRAILWSPDGLHILVTDGTEAINGIKIYSYMEGKLIGSVLGYQYSWLNEHEVIYTSSNDVTPLRPYGNGKGKGITKFDISTGKAALLQNATPTVDYQFEFVDPTTSMIYIQKKSSNDNFIDENKSTSSYFKMNSDGTSFTSVDKLPISTALLTDNLAKQVKGSYILNLLPYGDSKTLFIVTMYTTKDGFVVDKYDLNTNSYTSIVPNAFLEQ